MATAIDRAEFVNILNAVKPGLSRKDIIAQAECFAFLDGRVMTYNDIVAVSHPLPEGVELTGAVKAEELIRVCSKLKAKEIQIETTEGELHISTARTRVGVKMEQQVQMPFEAVGVPDTWVPIPENMLEAMSLARFSAGKDLSKPILTYVLLRGNAAISSDDFRITLRKYSRPLVKTDVLVNAEFIQDLVGYKPTEFGETVGWLHFRNEDDVTFSLRTPADAEYMDVTPFLEVKGIPVELPVKELAESVELAREVISSKDPDPYLDIKVEKGILLLKAEGPYAWLKRRHKVNSKKDFAFRINPDFFQDSLSIADSYIVGTNSMRIESSDPGFIHVVLLTQED